MAKSQISQLSDGMQALGEESTSLTDLAWGPEDSLAHSVFVAGTATDCHKQKGRGSIGSVLVLWQETELPGLGNDREGQEADSAAAGPPPPPPPLQDAS